MSDIVPERGNLALLQQRTLIVVRHAKSSWAEAGLSDHDRPLNKRGFRDAPRMGTRLSAMGYHPQIVFSSTALRARTTAELLVAELGLTDGVIETSEALYGAMPGEVLDQVGAFDDVHDTAMVVAHNPGITELVNYLGGSNIYNVPTCGVAILGVDGGGWQEFIPGNASLIHYDYPKSKDD